MTNSREAATWLGGIHAVESLLQHAPERVLQIHYIDKAHPKLEALLQLAKQQRIAIHGVRPEKLEQLLPNLQHQGIAAQCRPLPTYTEHDLIELIAKNSIQRWLILDGVQDPHNLGACLRSADAAGVSGVIIPKDRATGLTPVVRKVASGAAETVPLVIATNLARVIDKLQDEGIFVIGLAGEATQNLYQLDLRGPIALALGAEDKGLRRLTRDKCDALAALPMLGTISSLNVSVATGISLFEVVRQNLS
jgi:23S rRNA (guanosine2251-2'-O)-methyltransferase